jgi:hypothetical protein
MASARTFEDLVAIMNRLRDPADARGTGSKPTRRCAVI